MLHILNIIYDTSSKEKLFRYQYKGKSLEVKNAKPKADAMASKRSLAEVPLDVPASKQKKTDELLTKEGRVFDH